MSPNLAHSVQDRLVRHAREANLDPNLVLATVVREIARFVQPVLSAAADDAPYTRMWQPGGPWATKR